MRVSLFSLFSLVIGDLASAAPKGLSPSISEAADITGALVRRTAYGLPDPVHRFAFGTPVERPHPSTTTSTTHTTSTSFTNSIPTGNAVTQGYTPHAMVYSPYNADDSCKTASQVLSDIAIFASKRVQSVRIYATDCDTLSTVVAALKQYDMKLIQGFYMTSDGVDSIDSQVSDFITWLQEDSSNAGLVEMLIVGNEAVVNDWVTASELLAKITVVKAEVRQYGYTGPVTTAEPSASFIDNPSLCTSSTLDIVGINAHSYFDASSTPAQCGSFVMNQIAITQSACGGKTVFVTEAGYPHAGLTNGGNVPSYANQGIALTSLFEASHGYVTFFTYTDDLWKPPGPYGVEQSWGIIGGAVDFL